MADMVIPPKKTNNDYFFDDEINDLFSRIDGYFDGDKINAQLIVEIRKLNRLLTEDNPLGLKFDYKGHVKVTMED